ncbi:hypothetical protein BSKO_02048 [Bryopsis sp. KO-2023]|nr:hypothetical protein BSKO_02048 [Bryopsis sp. KO-2023]
MGGAAGFRWIVKEAYPLYAATGLASLMFAGFITKTVVTDPDYRVSKTRRTDGLVTEMDSGVGESHFNHIVRQMSHRGSAHIFPNEMMTRPNNA